MSTRLLAAAAVLLALLVAPPALAGQYDTIVSPCTGTYGNKTCADKATAWANVYITDNLAAYNTAYLACSANNSGATAVAFQYDAGTFIQGGVQCSNRTSVCQSTGCNGAIYTGKAYWTTECPPGGTWNPDNHDCGGADPTEEECLARNIPAEGDTDGRGASNYFYIVGTAPTSSCIVGCSITIDAAFRTFSGVNPATGEPVTWGEHERTWTGGTCDNDAETNQDGNPDSSMENPATNAPSETPEWSCDYANGTCVDPDGDPHFCTFTGSGTTASPFVRSTCVPAGGDTDGDGIPNPNDPYPNDPTDGQAGEEGTRASSGGGTCATPPTCTGDGILCNSLFQQWKQRCETEKLVDLTKKQTAANDAKSATGVSQACTVAPTCTGDAIQCANYLEQRKTRCAIEAMGTGTVVSGTVVITDPARDTQPEWTKVPEPVDPAAGQDPAAAPGVSTHSIGPADLDGNGFMQGGRSIPTIPSATLAYFGGMNFMGSDSDIEAAWIAVFYLFRALIMMLVGFACARIFAGLKD